MQTFYLSNADPSEMVQILTQILGTQGPAIRPIIYPNKTANAVQVNATAPVMQIIASIIQANDKPRAEVMIEVEILEVDRQRAKDLGLDLSNYALGFTFSPEVAPPNTGGTFPPGAPPFNLNTHQQRRERGGLLHDGADRADPAARVGRQDEAAREAAGARPRERAAHAEPRRRDSRSRRRRSCRSRRAAPRRSRRCRTRIARSA